MSQDWPTPAESAKAAEAEHTEHAHGLHHHAHLHAQPAAEPAQPVELAQNAFISRLTSYSLVNSSWNTIKGSYEAAKNYSPVIKARPLHFPFSLSLYEYLFLILSFLRGIVSSGPRLTVLYPTRVLPFFTFCTDSSRFSPFFFFLFWVYCLID